MSRTNERDAAGVPERVAAGDRVHAFTGEAITVTWSRRRCIHAADCVLRLPGVFEPGRRPWIDLSAASADAIARTVVQCPTGALHFERQDGGAGEVPPGTHTVRFSRNGATYAHGDLEVRDESGAVLLRDTRVALCRCGASANQPLCDGAHRAAGFRHDGAITDLEAVEDPGATSGGTLRVIPEPNGPLQLDGPFTLVSADLRTRLTGTSAWLCRCGHSQNKPFCDGSHERVGFRSAPAAAKEQR